MFDGRSPTIDGTGRQSRDFTHIDDVVAANILALDASAAAGGVFNIACVSHSLHELVETLNRLLETDAWAAAGAGRIRRRRWSTAPGHDGDLNALTPRDFTYMQPSRIPTSIQAERSRAAHARRNGARVKPPGAGGAPSSGEPRVTAGAGEPDYPARCASDRAQR